MPETDRELLEKIIKISTAESKARSRQKIVQNSISNIKTNVTDQFAS